MSTTKELTLDLSPESEALIRAVVLKTANFVKGTGSPEALLLEESKKAVNELRAHVAGQEARIRRLEAKIYRQRFRYDH